MTPTVRVFVPSAAALLTDRAPHGEGLAAWRLLSELARRGHDLVVCAREVDLGSEPPFELHELGRAARRESVEPLAYAVQTRSLLRRLGGARRFDLVHWMFPTAPHEALFVPPRDLPFVLGPHTAPWPAGRRARPLRAGDHVRRALTPLTLTLHRRALRRATALLFETDRARSGLPEAVRAKSHVVSGGVDVRRFPADRQPDARIVFVGRLERAKGVRELVEAFAHVRSELPHVKLVLAGDGADAEWIADRMRQLGLNGSLQLLGAVANAEVPDLLASAAVVCLPSAGEPYGYAALEGMAAGRAVVVANDGGPAEYVDPVRGGRLVPPGDVAALAAALVELMRDPERTASMGAFNRRRVESELSTERMAGRLERIYTDALR